MAATVIILSVTVHLLMAFIVGAQSTLEDRFLINIDCGTPSEYTDDNTGLHWVPDTSYIITGGGAVSSSPYPDGLMRFNSIRYFPDLTANKCCYQLWPIEYNRKYLVRTTYFSTGYHQLNLARVFDVLIDGTVLIPVRFNQSLPNSYYRFRDIVLSARSTNMSLCLARNLETDGHLFISSIEVRQIFYTMYNLTDFSKEALRLRGRANFGFYGKTVRYPDDQYDRIWRPSDDLLDTGRNISGNVSVDLHLMPDVPPKPVLETAISGGEGTDLNFSLPESIRKRNYYFSLYFVNIDGRPRNCTFTISVNGRIVEPKTIGESSKWCVRYFVMELDGGPTQVVLSPEKGSKSGLIINAAEMYEVLDRANGTNPADVLALKQMQGEVINLPNDWTGDPCWPPHFSWTGLKCSDDNPPRVLILNLTHTSLTGVVPSSLANLTALTSLMLGSNNLSGPIPPGLSSLNSLATLDLRNNRLSGDIPTFLENLHKLKRLFLQNNNLSGTIPPGLEKIPGLELGLDSKNYPGPRKNKPASLLVMLAGIGCTLLLIVAMVSVILWRFKRKKVSNRNLSLGCKFSAQIYILVLTVFANTICILLSLYLMDTVSVTLTGYKGEYHRTAIEYTEEDIKAGTRNYSQFIGKGSFGSVYYGRFSGQEVAVKVISQDSSQGENEFRNEVSLLSRIYHKNLVSLIGYCRQSRLALIYEYMHNGSLQDHLFGIVKLENPLDWLTRLNIALQAAEGFLYLHNGCKPPIIHRDIKCSNILLDGNMSAKVADFGLSRILDDAGSHISTAVKGTAGYLDPEYLGTSSLTEKSDVYSFGVVLLEIISGTSAITGLANSARNLLSSGQLEDLMDPSLGKRYNTASAWKVAEVAYACVEPKSSHRPKMSVVVKELQEAIILQIENQRDVEYSASLSFELAGMQPEIR